MQEQKHTKREDNDRFRNFARIYKKYVCQCM